jgi:hypothetical protein
MLKRGMLFEVIDWENGQANCPFLSPRRRRCSRLLVSGQPSAANMRDEPAMRNARTFKRTLIRALMADQPAIARYTIPARAVGHPPVLSHSECQHQQQEAAMCKLEVVGT